MGKHDLNSTEKANEDILNGIMIVASLPLAYYGSKLKEKLIFVIGFLLAGYGIYLFFTDNDEWLEDHMNIKVDSKAVIACSIIVGLIVGCCFVWTYKKAVFTLGALCGVLGSNLALSVIAFDSFTPDGYATPMKIAFVVIAAIIAGYMMMKAEKQIMKLITAIIGGFMFGASIGYFIERADGKKDEDIIISPRKFFNAEDTSIEHCDWVCSLALVGWAFISLTGILYQYNMCGVGSSDNDDDLEKQSRYNHHDGGFRSARKERKQRTNFGVSRV